MLSGTYPKWDDFVGGIQGIQGIRGICCAGIVADATLKKRGLVEGGVHSTVGAGDFSGFEHAIEGQFGRGVFLTGEFRDLLGTERAIGVFEGLEDLLPFK